VPVDDHVHHVVFENAEVRFAQHRGWRTEQDVRDVGGDHASAPTIGEGGTHRVEQEVLGGGTHRVEQEVLGILVVTYVGPVQ